MTDLVLDASVALSWCFKNEATEAADRVLERLADEAASVPAIWHLEVSNVLALSEAPPADYAGGQHRIHCNARDPNYRRR